ncbi:MAG: 3-phosphoshikimate 1-carboxyvinyltransferase, partial [Deltaproteobacteria bacterium RBG_13_52_11]
MEIKPIKGINATVTMPGSKSYTQRALIIAALAKGRSALRNALIAEDTGYMMEALRSIGSEIVVAEGDITINGTGGHLRNPGREIYLGNNGTAMRLLTGVVALGTGAFTLTGAPRLCQRPLKPLLDALTTMGVDARGKDKDGYPPVIVHAHGLRGGTVTFTDIESSQYISAILISAPFAETDTVIELQGEIPSLPYVDITVDVMKAFGVEVVKQGPRRYLVKSGQQYTGCRYRVEGDCSSASYFFLAAALCKGRVRVQHINPHTLQGDIELLPILEKLGCTVTRGGDWVEVVGGELVSGEYTFDLGAMPDMVPTLAILAALRPGRTIITNCSHLRTKESDRLAALATELRKIGVRAEEKADGLVIEGNTPHGAVIETYNDHRIAMSFAVLGLVVPGIQMQDESCVDKSFPGFWTELQKLY